MSQETRNASIWTSWSWNGSGDACGQEIWSESGGVLGIVSLGSGTYKDTSIGGEKAKQNERFDPKTVKPSVTELLTENHSTHLLLMRGGLRRHIGGGGGIRRGGDSLRGGGRTR